MTDSVITYQDLRDFLAQLEAQEELHRVAEPVSTYLEMTALCDRVLRAGGPALLFENPLNAAHQPVAMPVLGNLFGTPRRVALGMGREDLRGLRELGTLLAYLKEPDPPRSLREAWGKLPLLKQLWNMSPHRIARPICQQVVLREGDIDLADLPIQHCWPGDVAPLITWGLVVSRGPYKTRQNLGIYRQQPIGPQRLIMRWLAHRGGAIDFREHAIAHPGTPFPLAVVLGCDPATMLGAVTPVPDSLSEYQFAGLLRGTRTELARCLSHALEVPARAEIVLEGHIPPIPAGYRGESEYGIPLCERDGYLHALEGPYGDHTGYYNEQDWFPVFQLDCLTRRESPIYHSTYTGKPPDEPAVLGVALNEVFVPLLQKQFPEITDFYLPPEGCSYRLAVVAMQKRYPGHAKRVMMGVWSFLRQFMYTKWIVVVDDDIDLRDWKEVVWALVTRMDPVRDTVLVEQTPIDSLDFASPVSGLGSKIGFDATHKWPGETSRAWGQAIVPDAAAAARVEKIAQGIITAPSLPV